MGRSGPLGAHSLMTAMILGEKYEGITYATVDPGGTSTGPQHNPSALGLGTDMQE